ncbi:MAG: tight adherence protein [Thermoleophilaceae bacterium]|nr:tight adherence protein [Thermoleophilaceae bacterium]
MAAQVLAFASAGLAFLALAGLIREARVHVRRDRGARLPGWLAGPGALVRRAGLAARIGSPRDLEPRIAAAGLAGTPVDVRAVMASKAGAGAAGAAIALLLAAMLPGRLGIVLVAAGPVAGFLAPDIWLRRLARARADRIRRELPAVLDLLRVTSASGMSLTASVGAVGEGSAGVLAGELRAVAAEVALGLPLAAALDAMVARTSVPEVAALVGALERAARHGSPLTETLAAQARGARELRSQRVREEAARAGPKIQLVVALLLVPSVLLMVAAALAGALLGPGGAGLPMF